MKLRQSTLSSKLILSYSILILLAITTTALAASARSSGASAATPAPNLGVLDSIVKE